MINLHHNLLTKTLDLFIDIGNPLLSWLNFYLSNQHLYISVFGSFWSAFTPLFNAPQNTVPFLSSSSFLSITPFQLFVIQDFAYLLMIWNCSYGLIRFPAVNFRIISFSTSFHTLCFSSNFLENSPLAHVCA